MADLAVVDCSIVAKWVLPEPGRDAARELYQRYAAGEIDLVAPDLLIAELASLLSRRVRQKQISAAVAMEAFQAVLASGPTLVETRPILPAAFALSLRHGTSLWDSVYLALADERDCPFLTADERLWRGGAGRHHRIRLLLADPL